MPVHVVDEAGVLPDRLKDETRTLAAQDSFFAFYFTNPDSPTASSRSSLAQVPWGGRGAHRQRQLARSSIC